MTRRIAAILVLALLASLAIVRFTQSSSGTDPVRMLRRAYTEAPSISYSGRTSTSVFYCGREFRTTSTVRREGKSERIDYKNGITVVALADATRTYRPDKKQVLVSGDKGKRTPDAALSLLLKNYTPTSAGIQRVAARKADIIDLVPRHKGNPSKRLWIDQSTGTILRTEDRTSAGELRSRTEFTHISYSPKQSDNLFRKPEGVNSSWKTVKEESSGDSADVGRRAGVSVALPKYVPAGYVLDSIGVYHCGCACGHKAVRIRYTDGLNSISLYETPVDMKCGHKCKVHCPSSGRCEVRDANQAHVAMKSSGGRSTVVVADLPDREIAKIAESVK